MHLRKNTLALNVTIEYLILANTAQKTKFTIKDFFSKCDQIETVDLVTFAEESLNDFENINVGIQFNRKQYCQKQVHFCGK